MPPRHSQRLRVSIVSIVAGAFILVLKWAAFALTGSAALKSDALEGVVNVVAAFFAFGAILFAERPADENHPYGHGKIEYFSAAFEGGLISLASVLIMYEAFLSLYEGSHIKSLGKGMLLNLLAGALNGILGWWLVKQGRQQNSQAIEADGHHVLSDFYTTLGLLAGLLAVKFSGFTWLDPLLALGVGGLLAATGYKLVRGSAAALLDQEDPKLIVKLVAAMNRVRTDDVVAIHALRTLRSGRYTHVDIHVAVPEYYPIGQAHDLIEKFGQAAIAEAGEAGEFHAHVDPCDRFYCKRCAVSGCLIRAEACSGRSGFSVAEAVSPGPNDDVPPAYSSSPLDLTQNQMRP